MQIKCRSLHGSMVRNIKETFPPKTGMWKKQVLQDPGYAKGVKTACCMLHSMLQGCMKYPMSNESKEIKNSHNTVDLRHLSLMSKELKVHSIDIMLQLYYSCQRSQKSIQFKKQILIQSI